MIILHKLRQFAPAPEHILEIFGWNDAAFLFVLILPTPQKFSSASVSRSLLCEAQAAPQWTAPYCAHPPTPQHHHPLPGPWNCPDTQFHVQQPLPLTLQSLQSLFEAHIQATMAFKQHKDTS
ncbi:hypothetical protein Hamer_G005337 [Homarus americanus]|uniref:Uncharacterized protein n=1 Tax=Homarus americanus TaxID=6706 RepID=A0A8J5K0D2_HOMAM|nr:hypothetical protein Hamer_G005337 [Homarus americanus]